MRNTQLALALRNAQGDVLARQLDNGYLRLYSGAQPATADTAITTQVLLCELRFASPSAPAVTTGTVVFNPIAPVAVATAGTATWFRALRADGTTAVLDGSVGGPNDAANLTLANPVLTAGPALRIDAFTHAVLASTAGA